MIVPKLVWINITFIINIQNFFPRSIASPSQKFLVDFLRSWVVILFQRTIEKDAICIIRAGNNFQLPFIFDIFFCLFDQIFHHTSSLRKA
ncbi:MAG: hypothetical protein COB67_13175 [SAR324 cluster bacterium]|uniref:Uncharacterized protein n=1 Tax=SAR324 cluster bacterium TaxID=2024889 RepID=A0A2A4SPB6_9DELT|nr:MAG: hypothetical protein COB67_13175 [SAR324 cluster bacterium]